jgi:CMP-N-acetylneuraminic acid synthetase
MTRALAIIPARGGSKRLPGKNLRDFLGKPLIHWSIEFARAEPRFDEVLVSTDAESIAQVARDGGASVPWLRPAELAADTAATVDVVLHALARFAESRVHFDYVAVLQPTTPLRLAERWQRAFQALDAGAPAAIGVAPAPVHPFWSYQLAPDGGLLPFFPDRVNLRSQDLPPACTVNGSLYLARSKVVESERTLAPKGVRGVLCELDVESADIDTQADFDEAERLVREYQRRTA